MIDGALSNPGRMYSRKNSGSGYSQWHYLPEYRWQVLYDEDNRTLKVWHHETLIAEFNEKPFNRGWYLADFYGESKSDADALNAMCAFLGEENYSFTFRPVNGGFMRV